MAQWDEVLDEMFRTRRRALVGYAYLLTGNMHEADDVVQDAFVKTFRRGRRANDLPLAEAYVRRAILTIFIDSRRASSRLRDTQVRLVDDPARASLAPTVDTRVDVQAALRCLSPRERACVVLRYYDDLTVPEVARRLGMREGTAKRYLHDANAKLARELGPRPGAARPFAPQFPATTTEGAS
ncbi:RNA polymerase sigma-70 factor (ECF subfamily) [Sediminihabitans luteus]|uniref:RNA polymerase sigma-70 factor (ECF subfamily) n=1 Tax=Sediminihabitans luteus TaxID=1138585 RepID=A0A2M9D019_9CELL|nr:sigma-70 family RNA polymerase sigma factor [Sediminihabitans luteus]PJJ77534.1 RNA polymerase sigma-70 factor (ECF subfamily) [Sediminihabitans luteus]GII98433.1 DNA-directed RNA polymerase sigma-70 factor [Sediminihabitans luteus]